MPACIIEGALRHIADLQLSLARNVSVQLFLAQVSVSVASQPSQSSMLVMLLVRLRFMNCMARNLPAASFPDRRHPCGAQKRDVAFCVQVGKECLRGLLCCPFTMHSAFGA